VAQIIEYMKGKSSIWIAQNVERKMRNFSALFPDSGADEAASAGMGLIASLARGRNSGDAPLLPLRTHVF
jgi:hypothetical protein